MANGVFYLPYFDGKKEVYLVVDKPPQAAQMLASAAASPTAAPSGSSFYSTGGGSARDIYVDGDRRNRAQGPHGQ